MATLDVEFEAVSDAEGKFAHLAQLLGLADADHARGKVEHLWVACTTRGESDLPQWVVEKHLGPAGAAALVEAELGRWGRGRGDTNTRRIHIRGAEKRCLWMRQNHEQSSKGGKARASTASRAGGKFTSRPLVESDQPKPAPSPSPSPSPSPYPEDQNPSPAHAILPTPVPSTTPAQSFADRDLAKARAIGDLALATWQRLSELRMRHASKLRLEGVLPLVVITPGTDVDGFRELRARIRAEGESAHRVCDHVLAVLDEQALDTKSIEWLSEKACLERPWRKARETTLKPKRKPPVAAPAPAAAIAPADLAGKAELAEAWAVLGIGGGEP